MGKRTSIEVRTHEFCLRIDGVPHLVLRRSDIVGLQSYVRSRSAAEPIHYIEFAMRAGEVVCDYEDRTLWEEILNGIAAARLFDQRIGEN